MSHSGLRQGIVRTCREMNAKRLNQGTSGNLSCRIDGGMLITPSGIAYDRMAAQDVVEMSIDGRCHRDRTPSSEWRFHRDILAARPDVNVVLHSHSIYATSLAIHQRPIPAVHYMVAVGGGVDIRCAPYACFGTQRLSDHVLAALQGRMACLLAHHGLIVLATSLEQAMWRLIEVETLAEMYVHALAIGEPPRLTEADMNEVFEQVKALNYGSGNGSATTAPPRNAEPPQGRIAERVAPGSADLAGIAK
ncbi:MAG TPA: class II aldolase/adducin family protein [Rhodopseudomonas sp.]|uniref:class II aldolase/adducin family protein n=1 Tax=Rhodopseudomonas sp. TaxID=1078 RepID=UPI002ED7FD0F